MKCTGTVPVGGRRRWAHYSLMIADTSHEVGVGARYVEIDDFTEDF
jgi:hypothetical protein